MSEDSFLREVEDELRSDRMRRFWRSFAPFVIGGAVLIVVVVAGTELWSWWRASQAAEASQRFYTAQELAEAGDTEGALAAFQAIAAEGPDGYATLARFREAALLSTSGDTAAALAVYDGLATNAPDAGLRELALVLAAYRLADGGDVTGVQTRVSGIIESDSALRLPAREALGLAQYASGDAEAARASFEALAAESGAGQDLQGRALLYLEVLNADTDAAANAEPLGLEGLPVAPSLEDLAPDLAVPSPESGAVLPEAAPADEEAAPAAEEPASEAPPAQ